MIFYFNWFKQFKLFNFETQNRIFEDYFFLPIQMVKADNIREGQSLTLTFGR